MHTLPLKLQQTIRSIFGQAGERWIDRFPDLLAHCREQWRLTLATPYSDLSINYVTAAYLPDGQPVVLKLGVPHREMETEIEALSLYGGRHIARCLASDAKVGALLLECLAPGRKLYELNDNRQETLIAAGLMRDLPIPVPAKHHLPSFTEWIERAFTRYRRTYGSTGPFHNGMHDAVEGMLREIEQSKTRDVLLHGDLHHANIIEDAQRGWTVIDPKGVIGDPCLEVGRFLHNQLPDALPAIERMLTERVDILKAELHEPAWRIWRCALIDKVLSLTWSLEDEDVRVNLELELAVARSLRNTITAMG